MTTNCNLHRSGTVNSNTVNLKFHLIWSYCEIFFYNFPNISCLKCTVNSNFHLIRSKNLADEWLRIIRSRPVSSIYSLLLLLSMFMKLCSGLPSLTEVTFPTARMTRLNTMMFSFTSDNIVTLFKILKFYINTFISKCKSISMMFEMSGTM